MKIRSALPLLALALALALAAAGCGGSAPSTPSVAGLPIALSCTTTSVLYDSAGQTWRVQISVPGPDGWRALLFTRSDTFPHAGVAPASPFSFTARASAQRFDVGVVQLSFDGGSIDVLGFEGAEGAMWSGTADIRSDKSASMSCWDPQWKPAYHYDAQTGACLDANGIAGVNWLLPGMVRELGSGECARLTGRLDEEDERQPQLVGWKLAGADLSTASLYLADMPGADLRGANLAGFEFGYATLGGTVDAHTQGVPAPPICSTSGSQVSCAQ